MDHPAPLVQIIIYERLCIIYKPILPMCTQPMSQASQVYSHVHLCFVNLCLALFIVFKNTTISTNNTKPDLSMLLVMQQ